MSASLRLSAFAPMQPRAVAALQRIGRGARRPHALAITGSPAATPSDVAKAWVASSICQAPIEPWDACGRCDLCDALAHRRLSQVFAVAEPPRIASVDDVRQLKSRLALTSGAQAPKVISIPYACRLGAPAQNALLKVLEEPPPHTMFVLEVERWALLLPTVRSRLLRVHLTTPPRAGAIDALTAAGIDAVLAPLLAPQVGGNRQAAQAQVDAGIAQVHENLCAALVPQLPTANLTRLSASMTQDREHPAVPFALLEIFLRDALAQRLCRAKRQNPEAWAHSIRVDVPTERLAAAVDRLCAMREAAPFNPNRTLQLENMLLLLSRRDCPT